MPPRPRPLGRALYLSTMGIRKGAVGGLTEEKGLQVHQS